MCEIGRRDRAILRFGLALILSLLGGALTAWAFVFPLLTLPLVAVIAGIYGMIAGLIVFPFLYVVLRRREIQQTIGIVYGSAVGGSLVLGFINYALDHPPGLILGPFGFTFLGLGIAWCFAPPRVDEQPSNRVPATD
jgi:hypothetical protein